MDNKEAAEVIATMRKHEIDILKINAYDRAIKVLEQMEVIETIINSPIYIQEDVLRYKMICEVVKKMTKEEAIQELKTLEYYDRPFDNSETKDKKGEALFMAIRALEQEPCEDEVSRQEVLDILEREKHKRNNIYSDWSKAIIDIQDLSSVSTEKTGRWILTIEDWNKWTCSECGYYEKTDIHVSLGWGYCPNCGARMEVENG